MFEHLGGVPLDDKSKRGLQRLLTVWEERGVFGSSAIHAFKRGYGEALHDKCDEGFTL